MKDKDFDQLWEEDGNRNLINSFFSGPKIELAQKEHIKELVLEKLANDKNTVESPQTTTTHLNTNKNPISKLREWLKTIWWRWQWKLAVPVVALVFLCFIGAQIIFSQKTIQLNSGEKNVGFGLTEGASALDQQNSVASGGLPKMNDTASSTTSKGLASIPQSLDSRDGDTINPSDPKLPVPTLPPADPNFAKKITHNLNVTLQVANVTDAINTLYQEFQQMGGYVVESQQNGQESGAFGHITAKIPVANFDTFRTSLPNIGKVSKQSQTANDITNQYYDAQTRLQNWEAEQLRYLDILKQAKTIEEILKVEGALANIRQQIEQLKGQLKLWNNEVDYSTVQIELQTIITPNYMVSDPWQPVSLLKTWKATKDAVLKTISITWNVLNYVLVGLGYVFPYLVLLGIIYTGYRIYNKRRESVSR